MSVLFFTALLHQDLRRDEIRGWWWRWLHHFSAQLPD